MCCSRPVLVRSFLPPLGVTRGDRVPSQKVLSAVGSEEGSPALRQAGFSSASTVRLGVGDKVFMLHFYVQNRHNNNFHAQVLAFPPRLDPSRQDMDLPPGLCEDSMREHSWCSGSENIVEATAMTLLSMHFVYSA